MAQFPTDWFWFVAGDETRAWSTAASAYVPAAQVDAAGLTRIASEAELDDVLLPYGLAGPTTRREIPKRLVAARLDAIGKGQVAMAALQSNTLMFNEWFLHGLNVYADDEQLLAMLHGVGCTAEEIATVTAP